MSVSEQVTRIADQPASPERAPIGRNHVGPIANGLPKQWYPILRSSELKGSPVRVKRFGEMLAVWRDGDGNPHVVQDRCPHRGASLSLGTIRGASLSCPYHGWTFDRTGACVDIPFGDKDAKRTVTLGRSALKGFPAEDRAGYIWVFYGPTEEVTPLTVVPYELEDERWFLFQQEYVWNTNWLNILDNILDPVHALFVHLGVATQLNRAQLSQFEIVDDFDEGFRMAKRGLLGGKMTEETPAELRLPSVFRLDLANGTQRGVMRVIMISTPIDENSTYLCYIQGRRVSGLARLWWKLQWRFKYRAAQDIIKAQDLAILERLGPIEDSRRQENLSHSDIGVVHLRRRLSRAYADSQVPKSERPKSELKPGPRYYAAWESDPA